LIDEEVEDTKKENPNLNDIDALFDIVRKFENAIMVGIEVDTNKDAYMLFESLNHRGASFRS
jgi:predicted CoA-binding protein